MNPISFLNPANLFRIEKPQPITILSGDTGVGKTSTGKLLVEKLTERGVNADKIGVVLNDADWSGIVVDQSLYPKGVRLASVDSGCACCEQALAVIESVKRLKREGCEFIMVELAGTSDHYVVQHLLAADPTIHQVAPTLFHISAERPAAESGRELMVRELIASSDRVILTKAGDRAAREQMIAYINEIRGRGPDLTLLAPPSLSSPDAILPKGPHNEDMSPNELANSVIFPKISKVNPAPSQRLRRPSPSRIGIELYPELSLETLVDNLEKLPLKLSRVKGYMTTSQGEAFEINLSAEELEKKTRPEIKAIQPGSWKALGGRPCLVLRTSDGVIDPEKLLSIGIPNCREEQIALLASRYAEDLKGKNPNIGVQSADYLVAELRTLAPSIHRVPAAYREIVERGFVASIRLYTDYRVLALDRLRKTQMSDLVARNMIYGGFTLNEALSFYGAPRAVGLQHSLPAYQYALDDKPETSDSLRIRAQQARPSEAWVEGILTVTEPTFWHQEYTIERNPQAVGLLGKLVRRAVLAEKIPTEKVLAACKRNFELMDAAGNHSFSTEAREEITKQCIH